MPQPPWPTTDDAADDLVLSSAFERLRPRLVMLVARRVGHGLAARIDPEGVVQEAYLRARPRWRNLDPRPDEPDAWIHGQVRDRLIELIRSALGPQRDLEREVPWPDVSESPLVEQLVDSETGASSALSREERREVVRHALAKLGPIDREILTLRYFEVLNFAEIGEFLDLSQNAATKRCLRAIVALRDWIPVAFRPTGGARS